MEDLTGYVAPKETPQHGGLQIRWMLRRDHEAVMEIERLGFDEP